MSDSPKPPKALCPGSKWRRVDDGDVQRIVSIEKTPGVDPEWEVCAVGGQGAFLGPMDQFIREAVRV